MVPRPSLGTSSVPTLVRSVSAGDRSRPVLSWRAPPCWTGALATSMSTMRTSEARRCDSVGAVRYALAVAAIAKIVVREAPMILEAVCG